MNATPATTVQTAQSQPQQLTPKQRVDILKNNLSVGSVMEQFTNALGKNASLFVASIIDLYTSDSKLQLCDPNKVIKECLKAAVINLPIIKALGQAFILPFNNTKKDANGRSYKEMEPTFQIGYKGYYQLAMRTNQYKIINQDVVYEGELRKVSKLTGELDIEGERISDKIVGYFAYFELNNGFKKALYMSVEQMAAHAKRYSKALTYNNAVTVASLMELAKLPFTPESNTAVGWLGNFHSMAIKTVLRNLLSKYGYLSVELQQAITSDDEAPVAPSENRAENAPLAPQQMDATTVDYEEVSPEPAEAPEIEQPNPGF